jgi:2-keto-3-deoxy-L-arabinonate dehydratase
MPDTCSGSQHRGVAFLHRFWSFDMTGERGVIPILYSYFGSDGGIDRRAMDAQVEACLALQPDGIAVLGLATEVEKLSFAEKRLIVEGTAKRTSGRTPLVITIGAPTAAERLELIRLAEDHGAAWLILQPPPEIEKTEAALLAGFDAIMAAAKANVAIQHAPQYLGVGLTNASFVELRHRYPHFTLLKGEGSALETAELLAETDKAFAVFAGRGGLEWPDMIRVGAAGLIPAPETLDVHQKIWRAAERGDWVEADRLYHEALPLITFLMQSLGTLRCYGKRLLARRIGLGPVNDRAPALIATPQGEALLDHWAKILPEWGA